MAAPVVISFAFAFTALMMAGVSAQGTERHITYSGRTGNVCSEDQSCPDNAFCRQGSYCVCKDGYIFVAVSDTSKACLKDITYSGRTGNVCSEDQSCPDNAFCRQGSYCVCKDGYIFVAVSDTSKACLKVGLVGDPCEKHIQCHTMMGIHSECIAGTCACKPETKLIDDRCYQTAVIGQRCVLNQNCFLATAENDPDKQGFCVRGVCTCQLQYSPRDNGTRCVKDARLFDPCEDQEQCAGVGLECRGTCHCKDGFAGHNETGECMKTVGALNDTCEYDVQCQDLAGAPARPEAALCLSGQCTCAYNARAAAGRCWVTRRPGQSCHRDEECLSEEDEPGYCLNGVCTCKTCVPDARDFGGGAAIAASLPLAAILVSAAILV